MINAKAFFDLSMQKEGLSLEQNDLIQRILATERQAQAITENARSEHENMDARIEEELAALKLRYTQEADAYLDGLRKKAEAEGSQRLAALSSRLEEKLAQIENIYSAQKEAWAENIFQRITGKDGG